MAARIKIPQRRRQPERGLHLVVARFLDMALPQMDSAWWHTPNGGARNVIEAAQLKRMGTRAGIPDVVIVHRGRVFGIELKAGGYLSKAQKATHESLVRAGMHVTTCRSLDEVQSALDSWSIPVHARTFGFAA